MDRKLTRKDLINIAIAAIVTIGAIVFLKHNMRKAFPEISLKFSIERDEATQKAAKFLEDMGFDLTDYHKTTVFSSEYLPRLYIDKELGPEYLKVYADSGVKLWFWTSRFFKPLSKREYYVDYDPVSGKLKGFERELEDEAEGASLDPDSAQRIALAFLETHADFDTSEWRLVKSNVIKRPNRLDHEFVWERKGFKIKDATYRMRVVVQGDEVGTWEQFLKVPEAWKRDYRKMRSYNSLLQSVTNAIFILMVIAMVYVLITRWRKRKIDWKIGLSAGGFIAVISFITMVNRLPLMIAYSYDTMSSLTAFYLKTIASFFFTSLLNGVVTTVAFAAGENLYREVVSKRLYIRNFLSLKGFYTKEGFMAVIYGYMAATWFLTWVTAFYLVGKKFGFWSPADVEYSNIVNSYLPWVFALAAFLPAMMEEGMFRLFGVPFFKKVTKSMALGLIIPAFIWGFLHSSYPVQPAYARGLEVGIGGIFFGVLMLRMGIVSPIVLHYAVDAFFFAYYLFIGKSLYLKIAAVIGVGIFAIPFVISLVRYLKRGEFEPSESLTNEANLPPSVEEEVETVAVERPEFSRIPKWGIIGVGALVVGVLLVALFKPYRLGHDLKVKLRPKDAVKISEDFLKSKGYDLKDYHGIAVFNVERWDTQEVYMRVHGGFAVVDSFFRTYRPSGAWTVRWFKPLETEEFTVRIAESSDGSNKAWIYQFEHTLPETAAGADLPLDSAKVIAAQYLEEHGFNLSGYQLYKSESEKREHRTDHELGWESNEPFVGEAKVRLDVSVQGDEPQGPDIYLKVPEKWTREFYKKTAWDSIRYILRTILMLVWAMIVVFFIVKGFLRNQLDYKVGAKYLLVGLIFGAILPVYSVLPGVIAQFYYTAMPYTNFITTYISGTIPTRVILIATAFVLAWLAAYRRHRIKLIDAAVAFGLGVLFIGVVSLLEWLRFKLGLAVTAVSSLSVTPIWERLPFNSAINRWLTGDLLKFGSIFVLFGGLLKNEDPKKWLKIIGILLLLAIVKASSTITLTEALGVLVVNLIVLFVLFAVWEYALKRDFTLSMVFIGTISVLPMIVGMIAVSSGLVIYGIIALLVAALSIAFIV